MNTVAEFTVPPEPFPFGITLAETPTVEIEVDRTVPTEESVLLFFWVRGCDPEVFIRYAEREPEVRDTRTLEAIDRGALFRAEWTPNASIIDGLRELNATIVEAIGTAERWRFEIRTESREAVTQFKDVFESEGISISLDRTYSLGNALDREGRSVTEIQRETLIAAFDGGYFDIPRKTSQRELGERFHVTPRAVSERLRRGMRNLIRDSLRFREET